MNSDQMKTERQGFLRRLRYRFLGIPRGTGSVDSFSLREGEKEILTNLKNLHDKEIEDCMVPRAQIVSIEIDEKPEDLLALMNESGHSRVPAYRETLDDTIGFIHIKDLVARLMDKRAFTLRDVLRPVLFVVPSMPVDRLMLQMRQRRQHMAMVIDEFGGIDGLVTIEDLIEEIVGNIEDEHDAPTPPPVITRADGTLLVDASMPIEDFEALVGEILTSDERETIDTLAGYVFHVAGHVPEVGETIHCPRGFRFDILDGDSTRIKRVRVVKG